ncbi:MAG TPA: glycosyltransferase [bacterium]|nr:glycosyltransferase [bacterium]
MRILQAMNALDPTDAVTLHLLELDRMLGELGHQTAIYSDHSHPQLNSRRRPIAELPHAEGDLLLFHYAGYSRCLGLVSAFRGLKGVIFHNVTPAEHYRGFPEAYEFCDRGRKQLPSLPQVFDFAVGDSVFNVEDLRQFGMGPMQVLPLSSDTAGLRRVESDPQTVAKMREAGPNLLMVGRVAPPKGVLEAVRALPEIQRAVGKKVRLWIVGRTRGYESYVKEIEKEMIRGKVRDEVILTGEVRPPVLRAFYENADALLVLSAHEGFCLPIAEAMAFDLPVIAHRTTAVAETLGSGGMYVEDRTPKSIAEALTRVFSDAAKREEIIAYQRERRGSYSSDQVRQRLKDILDWTKALPSSKNGESDRSVSVIVCTYNRHWILEKCLLALRNQEYAPFEVVVVNGPSTAETSAVLDRFPDIKRVENPRRNLSLSRNLGIQASSGDFLAFIDDDALAEPDWIANLLEAFQDPSVAGAGGTVIRPPETWLQFQNGTITRFGLPIAVRNEPGDFCEPHGEQFNIVMGTNAMFRRAALEAIGGFDENYEYYHDESDLCVQLIQNGFRIAHVPHAVVWHEFERSHIRKTERDVNWTVVAKNTIYFYFGANSWKGRPWDVLQPMRACLIHLGIVCRWFVRGEIGLAVFLRSLIRWNLGVAQGYLKGFFVRPRRNLSRHERPAMPFRSFGKVEVRGAGPRRHVVLVSQQYPPDSCGGIGVYTELLARGLVEAGHRATVIAHGKTNRTEWRDGVKIIRVPLARVPRGIPLTHRITRKNVARSLAVDSVLDRICAKEKVDIVEAAIWDAEVFATCARGERPVVLRLVTPMAVVAQMQGWPKSDDLELACQMEWEVVRRASAVVDSSGVIAKMLAENYAVYPSTKLIRQIPFGIRARGGLGVMRHDSEVRMLFVGRLEARKGFDILVNAIPAVLEKDPHVRFWVAGEGLESDWAVRTARDLAREYPDRVTLLGWVSDEQRDELYQKCDVFIAPSRYESFGLVYLEAMAHAKPCIACRLGGAEQIVQEGVTGILVPPGDHDALAEAVLRLARNREERERMGQEGLRRVERNFTVERMVEDTLALYDELLGDAQARDQEPAEALFR